MLQPLRFRIVMGALLAFAVALVGRTAWVQLWDGERWTRLGESQHFVRTSAPPPRGEILDVSGVPLARSEVRVHLNIVPPNVRESRRLQRDLQRLGVDAATRQRAADRNRKWVPVRKAFMPSDVVSVSALKGVLTEPSVQRDYLPGDGLRPVVGRTGTDGRGLDGIELMLDSLLQGERGAARTRLGPRGRRYESLDALSEPPRPGHTVTLTVSHVLQDICDRALADAERTLRISGGDIVVLEPESGEVRCLSSLRNGAPARSSAALVDPFEPGSTLKPFFAARLVEQGVARLDEEIETFDGRYVVCGRPITDVHEAAQMSLAQVIQYSSNIGIARFTERLAPADVYGILRDAGFGTPTGIAWPSESPGILSEPRRWSCPTQAALSRGYEIAVTPLQLAAAYGAIANGGMLMVPTLIKSIRDADGLSVYDHRPQEARRVMQPKTARQLRDVLAAVVDSGTATDAALATFDLGGKSGTARRFVDGRYVPGRYTSTFVGLFPARDPQYVILVKLDDPQGTYYGGKTAAPVAKAVLQAAIAARSAALDRGGLATQRVRYEPPESESQRGRVTSTGALSRAADDDRVSLPAIAEPVPLPPPQRVRFDLRQPHDASRPDQEPVAVPDVRGLPARVAARELHRAGLRVTFVTGVPYTVSPSPGAVVSRGTLVRVARK